MMAARRGGAQHSSMPSRRGAVAGGGYGRGSVGTARLSVMLLAKALLVPLASAAPLSTLWSETAPRILESDVESPKSPEDPNLWAYLGVAIALVLLGGAFAGLTIALMGQDETYLQVISSSGEGAERRHATKVLNLLKKGKHWVLVTLLLSNVITNETLPIVLDRSLGGGWPAVLSSTVLIVIFGEIVPQSICVRYGLSIGAYCAPMVMALMWIMCPVAWPTAKLLDYLLGEDHGTMYKKAGLKTLVQLHKTLCTAPGERLMEDEVTIINSVLDLKDKPVGDIMTPMQDVFTMSADTVLDERMMDIILSQGYSRIPIYAPDNNRNFIGMLLVKILITYDPEDAKRVRDFSLATLPETAPHTSCLDIINFFQEGKSHMVLVSDYPGQDRGANGVVTLEDVIEELIGEEIIDESDVFVDVHKAIRRLAPAPKQRYNKALSSEPPATFSDSEQDAKETDALIPNSDSPASRKPSLTNGNGTGTTFLVRRKSSSTAERINTSAAELRPQLRHLGPSNVASHPRATKFSNVKIKPGLAASAAPAVGTIPEGKQTTTGIDGTGAAPTRPSPLGRSQSDAPHSTSSDDDENTRLLHSAGRDASGGAAALRAEYGATDALSPTRLRRLSAGQMSAHEASELAEQKAVSPSPPAQQRQQSPESLRNGEGSPSKNGGLQRQHTLKVPDKKVVVGPGGTADEGDDQVGDMSGPPSRQRSMSRRAARSGSITETTVDYGGLKKVVLETTSSSSDVEEGGSNGISASPTAEKGGDDGDAEDEAEGKGGSGAGGDTGSTGGGDGGSAAGGKKKKKKKGGKKKGGW